MKLFSQRICYLFFKLCSITKYKISIVVKTLFHSNQINMSSGECIIVRTKMKMWFLITYERTFMLKVKRESTSTKDESTTLRRDLYNSIDSLISIRSIVRLFIKQNKSPTSQTPLTHWKILIENAAVEQMMLGTLVDT
jgi:hypothetical protein